MGAYGNVQVTQGVGTSVKDFLDGAGNATQVTREHRASSILAPSPWTVTVAGQSNVVPASDDRVYLELSSTSSGRVYLRFDASTPSATVFHTWLEPNERREIDQKLSHLAVSMIGDTATGSVFILDARAT